MTDTRGGGLRAYLQKGGFVIFDDFKVAGLAAACRRAAAGSTFEQNMKRVLPDVRFFEMNAVASDLSLVLRDQLARHLPAGLQRRPPIFRGVYEDNDPTKRLLMIVNYNTDVSQFWEWSGTGLRPVDETNEAYKLGVNYVITG